MTRVRGARLPSLERPDVVAAVEAVRPPLLEGLGDADRVAVLPDVHYPYHPSTGMVTNPDVVDALLSTLTVRLPNSAVTLALRSGDSVDTERAAAYLGYDDIADGHDVAVETLDGEDARHRTGSDRSAAVPAALADATVLPVPSARVAGATPMRGSLGLLARASGTDATDSARVRRVVDAVDLAGALVDATYTFTGTPHRARTVFAGRDVPAVESALAALLGVDPDDVPGLRPRSWTAVTAGPAGDLEAVADADAVTGVDPTTDGDAVTDDRPPADARPHGDARSSVDEFDVSALAAELPNGSLPASTDPHPAVQAGYRLYTKVSGDVYPPQLGGGP